jgi:AcrR family transcriptional regulator
MSPVDRTDTHRDRIVATADRLFFAQGYRRTGVNQLIAEAGVARQTFFRNFPSKEDLGAAYLDIRASAWLAALRSVMGGRRDAHGLVRALFGYIEEIATKTGFRGCSLLNMTAEFDDADAAMRGKIRTHKQAQRALLREMLRPFGVRQSVADEIHVLIEGAMASAASLLAVAPIRHAARTASKLLDHDDA